MRITESFDYPAPVLRVYPMMIDEQFLGRVCVATHALSHDVAVREHGDGATVVTTRELPTAGFPDFARRLVGETITIVQTITYGGPEPDSGRLAEVLISMGTAPVSFRGSLSLAPSQVGTRVLVDGDLTSSVPLLGRKVEQSAAPSVISAIHKEHEVGLAWLAG